MAEDVNLFSFSYTLHQGTSIALVFQGTACLFAAFSSIAGHSTLRRSFAEPWTFFTNLVTASILFSPQPSFEALSSLFAGDLSPRSDPVSGSKDIDLTLDLWSFSAALTHHHLASNAFDNHLSFQFADKDLIRDSPQPFHDASASRYAGLPNLSDSNSALIGSVFAFRCLLTFLTLLCLGSPYTRSISVSPCSAWAATTLTALLVISSLVALHTRPLIVPLLAFAFASHFPFRYSLIFIVLVFATFLLAYLPLCAPSPCFDFVSSLEIVIISLVLSLLFFVFARSYLLASYPLAHSPASHLSTLLSLTQLLPFLLPFSALHLLDRIANFRSMLARRCH